MTKLYLPNGATRFASRRAYGLVYESSRMDPAQRLWHRARQLRSKLGGVPDCGAPHPEKPKRMRWATFDARLRQIERLEADADGHFAVIVARYLPALRTMFPRQF